MLRTFILAIAGCLVAFSGAFAQDAILARGNFADVSDRLKGVGVVTIALNGVGVRVLSFEQFAVNKGPDLKVWLSAAGAPKADADITDNEYVALGVLKSDTGDQSYEIAADVDLSKYRSVVIWCEQFKKLFSAAPLQK